MNIQAVLHKGQSFNVFNMVSLSLNAHLKALNPIAMHSQKGFRRNAGTRFCNALLEMVSVSYFHCIYELLYMTPQIKVKWCEIR